MALLEGTFRKLVNDARLRVKVPDVARQIAWRQDQASREPNVMPSVDVVRPMVATAGDDDVKVAFELAGTGLTEQRFTREVFAPYPWQGTEAFDVRGTIDDGRWQTFAVFKPGGTGHVGPISCALEADAAGMATVELRYNFDWPVRLVAIVKPGLSVVNPGHGTTSHHEADHRSTQTFNFIRFDELDSVHVQLCGRQTFEIHDLPLNAGATTRRATIVDERLMPSVPGLPPLDVALPLEMSTRWQLALTKWYQETASK